MLYLVFAHSRLYIVALIFYTCIWIPFNQIKRALLSIIGFVFGASPPPLQQQLLLHHPYYDGTTTDNHHQLIPVMKYEESEVSSRVNDGRISNSDLCSVCLGELGADEDLSQLPGCHHVFHFGCIRSWVDRNHFTCPLCRSPLLINLHLSYSN